MSTVQNPNARPATEPTSPDHTGDGRPAGNDVILSAHDVRTYFPIRRGVLSRVGGWVRAVDGVSLTVRRGKTLGLVGESGCGKTTLGRTILRLIPATSGRVVFDGVDVFGLGREALRRTRRQMQIIFQDPIGSLNPRMTIGNIVGEALTVHGIARGQARRDRVAGLLQQVGLAPAYMNRYPHEFSGGQRQRIGIARALALKPKFIVCDEPVSALDVSIQSQILNLLADLQDELGLSYLFIAHNLAVIEHFSDDVAVMYLGKIVEVASAEEIYANPRHPYTQALLSAAPEPDPTHRRRRVVLTGEVPSPIDPPTGCRFHPRCPFASHLAREASSGETTEVRTADVSIRVMRRCVDEVPELTTCPSASPEHRVACHYADQLEPNTLAEIAGR